MTATNTLDPKLAALSKFAEIAQYHQKAETYAVPKRGYFSKPTYVKVLGTGTFEVPVSHSMYGRTQMKTGVVVKGYTHNAHNITQAMTPELRERYGVNSKESVWLITDPRGWRDAAPYRAADVEHEAERVRRDEARAAREVRERRLTHALAKHLGLTLRDGYDHRVRDDGVTIELTGEARENLLALLNAK